MLMRCDIRRLCSFQENNDLERIVEGVLDPFNAQVRERSLQKFQRH